MGTLQKWTYRQKEKYLLQYLKKSSTIKVTSCEYFCEAELYYYYYF